MLTHFLRAATPKGTFPILNNITTSLKGSSGTTFTINLPSNLASGNGILIIVTVRSKPSISTPTGWTLVATGVGANTAAPRTSVFIKVSNGTEGATTSVTLGVANEGTAIAARITDWTSATSSVEGTVVDVGNTANVNPPSETASWGSASNLFVAIAGVRSNAAPVTYPSFYTLYNTLAENTTANNNRGETAIAARQLTAATEDPSAFTIGSATDCVAGTIVIRGT